MQLGDVYPAKARFYSAGKWEVWKKFTGNKSGLIKYFNTKKIGKNQGDRLERLSLTKVAFMGLDSDSFKKNLKSSKSISKRRRVQFSPPIFKTKEHLTQFRDPIERIPQKYSYRNTSNSIDVIGKQFSPTPAIKIENLKRTSRNIIMGAKKKKLISINFRLPDVNSPSSWTGNV